jgi:molecular chaperone DnaJ
MKRDYYAVLGIRATATVQEIRRAYRQLARQYSPDVNLWDPHAEKLFEEISQAYRVLSDPASRTVYDRYGHQVFSDRPAQAERPRGRGRVKGDSLHVPVDLSFEDAIRGVALVVELFRLSPCEACDASGARNGSPPMGCPGCRGSGVLWSEPGSTSPGRCPACGGSGERPEDPCPACNGRGVASASARIQVTIPPGVDTGAQLRFPGDGHSGPFGAPRGDLIVSTRVSPHPFFSRKGDNLYCEVPVTIGEAVLGARIRVPTLEGAASITIPPGTQSGQTFRLRGKGVPRLNGNGRGDLYITCRLEIPRHLDSRVQELFRELERLIADNPRMDLLTGHWAGRAR